MDIQNYRQLIWKLFSSDIKDNLDICFDYIFLQLATETIEFIEAYDSAKNTETIIDEAGDVLWYAINYFNLRDIQKLCLTPSMYSACENPIQYLQKCVARSTGSYAKMKYHNKSFSMEDIDGLMSAVLEALIYCIKDINSSVAEIMTYNINKLKNRHGSKYSSIFYNTYSQ